MNLEELQLVDFKVETKSGCPVVTRNFTFKSGDTLSFTATHPKGFDVTIKELHRTSAEQVIAFLQEFLNPK